LNLAVSKSRPVADTGSLHVNVYIDVSYSCTRVLCSGNILHSFLLLLDIKVKLNS